MCNYRNALWWSKLVKCSSTLFRKWPRNFISSPNIIRRAFFIVVLSFQLYSFFKFVFSYETWISGCKMECLKLSLTRKHNIMPNKNYRLDAVLDMLNKMITWKLWNNWTYNDKLAIARPGSGQLYFKSFWDAAKKGHRVIEIKCAITEIKYTVTEMIFVMTKRA